MTTKKKYEKPSTKVYVLKHRQQLLVGSATGDVNATMDGTWTEQDI